GLCSSLRGVYQYRFRPVAHPAGPPACRRGPLAARSLRPPARLAVAAGVGRDGGAGLGGVSLRLVCRTESRGSPGVEKPRAGKSRLFAYELMHTAMAAGEAATALRPSAIRIDDATGRCGFA